MDVLDHLSVLKEAAQGLAAWRFDRVRELLSSHDTHWEQREYAGQDSGKTPYQIRATPIQEFSEAGQDWIDLSLEICSDTAKVETHLVYHRSGMIESGFPIQLTWISDLPASLGRLQLVESEWGRRP